MFVFCMALRAQKEAGQMRSVILFWDTQLKCGNSRWLTIDGTVLSQALV